MKNTLMGVFSFLEGSPVFPESFSRQDINAPPIFRSAKFHALSCKVLLDSLNFLLRKDP